MIGPVIGLSCIVLLIVWLFFFASDYNIYQNLAVVLVLVIIGSVANRLLNGNEICGNGWDLQMGASEMGWRAAISAVTGMGWIAFLIAWLAFFAGDYNIYENLAIVLISILVMGGIMGLVWVPVALRQMP